MKNDKVILLLCLSFSGIFSLLDAFSFLAWLLVYQMETAALGIWLEESNENGKEAFDMNVNCMEDG